VKRPSPSQEPGLFDLPLENPAPRPRHATTQRAHPEIAPAALAPGPVAVSRASLAKARGAQPAGISARLAAGGADLTVLASAVVAVALGARLLGHQGPWNWLPFGLFLVVFSFLYAVVPLAFWGQTPGMAWRGLVARSLDGDALSFGQTFRRWLGGMATVLLGGLPTLLALATSGGGGRSLADLVSGSRTHATRKSAE
jgi:uncharacterized RDD family membrane protein YckC